MDALMIEEMNLLVLALVLVGMMRALFALFVLAVYFLLGRLETFPVS